MTPSERAAKEQEVIQLLAMEPYLEVCSCAEQEGRHFHAQVNYDECSHCHKLVSEDKILEHEIPCIQRVFRANLGTTFAGLREEVHRHVASGGRPTPGLQNLDTEKMLTELQGLLKSLGCSDAEITTHLQGL